MVTKIFIAKFTCTRVEGSFESRKFNIMYFYHKLYIRLSGMLKTLYQWSFLFNYLFWTLLTANAERKERTIRKVKVGGWDFFSLQIFFLFIFFVFVFFPRPLPVTDSFFFGSECPCTNFFNLEIPTYWMPGTGFKQIAFTLHVVFFAALRSKLYQIWMVYNFLLFRIWSLSFEGNEQTSTNSPCGFCGCVGLALSPSNYVKFPFSWEIPSIFVLIFVLLDDLVRQKNRM